MGAVGYFVMEEISRLRQDIRRLCESYRELCELAYGDIPEMVETCRRVSREMEERILRRLRAIEEV